MSAFVDTLKQKATDLSTERNRLKKKLAEGERRLTDINGALAGIETLLRLEGVTLDLSFGTDADTDSTKPLNGSSEAPALQDVLRHALADRRPHTVEDLIRIAEAKGIVFAGKHPFNTVNFTMMGMSRNKTYERSDDGRWKFVG